MSIWSQAMHRSTCALTCRQEAGAWGEWLSRGGRRKDDQQGDEQLR